MSLVELDAVQIRIRIAILKVAHVIKFIAFDLNDTSTLRIVPEQLSHLLSRHIMSAEAVNQIL